MPIFEFLCPACNRIYSFLSLAPSPARQPVCPKCGATGLTRVPSAFAVAGKAKEKPETPRGSQPDGAALSRMEGELMRMADGLDEKDAENPRVMAKLMRRMAEASGEPMTPTMDEMFRRLEAGEDPDALEEELGPQLEAETGAEGEGGAGGGPTHDDGLYGM